VFSFVSKYHFCFIEAKIPAFASLKQKMVRLKIEEELSFVSKSHFYFIEAKKKKMLLLH
jgi:hypothetical protein